MGVPVKNGMTFVLAVCTEGVPQYAESVPGGVAGSAVALKYVGGGVQLGYVRKATKIPVVGEELQKVREEGRDGEEEWWGAGTYTHTCPLGVCKYIRFLNLFMSLFSF